MDLGQQHGGVRFDSRISSGEIRLLLCHLEVAERKSNPGQELVRLGRVEAEREARVRFSVIEPAELQAHTAEREPDLRGQRGREGDRPLVGLGRLLVAFQACEGLGQLVLNIKEARVDHKKPPQGGHGPFPVPGRRQSEGRPDLFEKRDLIHRVEKGICLRPMVS